MNDAERWNAVCDHRFGQFEPPGPTVTLHLSLAQAIDVFEAYKASRYTRPWTAEIRSIFRAALAKATER